MACDFITKGRLVDCLKGMGGVKNIYIALYADYNITATAGSIASIGSISETFKWEFTGNLQGLTETPTISWDNGNKFVTQVLTGTIPFQAADTQNQLELLMINRMIVFVEDYNDNIKAMGLENSVKQTNGSSVTGLAKGDLSGYTVEFTAEELRYAPFLSAAAKTALLATVSEVVITNAPVV
jgi:hypothetical protein